MDEISCFLFSIIAYFSIGYITAFFMRFYNRIETEHIFPITVAWLPILFLWIIFTAWDGISYLLFSPPRPFRSKKLNIVISDNEEEFVKLVRKSWRKKR